MNGWGEERLIVVGDMRRNGGDYGRGERGGRYGVEMEVGI